MTCRPCHAAACQEQVERTRWFCSRHWNALPEACRRSIAAHWRPGRPSRQFVLAIHAAWLALAVSDRQLPLRVARAALDRCRRAAHRLRGGLAR